MACPNNPPPEPWQLAPPVYTHIYNNTCRFPTYAELRWAPDQACIREDLIGWEDGFGRSNILPNVFRRVATKFFLIGWRNWIVNEKAVRKSRVVDALFSLEWVYHFPFSQTVSTAFHFTLLTLLTKALFTVSHCFFLFSPLSLFSPSLSLWNPLFLSLDQEMGEGKGSTLVHLVVVVLSLVAFGFAVAAERRRSVVSPSLSLLLFQLWSKSGFCYAHFALAFCTLVSVSVWTAFSVWIYLCCYKCLIVFVYWSIRVFEIWLLEICALKMILWRENVLMMSFGS